MGREKVMSLPLSTLFRSDAGRLSTTALQYSVPIVDPVRSCFSRYSRAAAQPHPGAPAPRPELDHELDHGS